MKTRWETDLSGLVKTKTQINLLGFELVCLMKIRWETNPFNIVMHVFLLSVRFMISLPGENQVGD